MSLNVFVNFNGSCREAVQYYAKVFETDAPKIMSYGDTPPDPEFPMTEDMKQLVMYTELHIAGSKIMFSDLPPNMPFRLGNNITIAVNSTNKDTMKRWFGALREDGKVERELEQTFWSELYGNLTDKYGICWQFNFCHE